MRMEERHQTNRHQLSVQWPKDNINHAPIHTHTHTHLRPSSMVVLAPLPLHRSRKGMLTSLWINSLKRDSFLRVSEALLKSSSKNKKSGAHWDAGLLECRKMRSHTTLTCVHFVSFRFVLVA